MNYSTSGNNYYVTVFNGPMTFFWLAYAVLVIAGMWKTFSKAGKPGWTAIIPIYNLYIWLKIVNRPGWWLLLFLIPIVNLIISIMISVELAKVFGKGAVFGFFWVWLFAPIGWLLLGFGKAKYVGTASMSASTQV